MKSPRNTSLLNERNRPKAKATGFTFNWDLPTRIANQPPLNLPALAEVGKAGPGGGSDIEMEREQDERRGRASPSESKTSDHSSSYSPNRQGDELINYINQKTQEQHPAKLTSVKLSQANHALQLHQEATQHFRESQPTTCRSASNTRKRTQSVRSPQPPEPPRKTASYPLGPFAQLGYTARVSSAANPFALSSPSSAVSDSPMAGCSSSPAQRLGIDGIFDKGQQEKKLKHVVLKTEACNVRADRANRMRIKLESGVDDMILSRGCRIWGSEDGKLAIEYDCTDSAVSSVELSNNAPDEGTITISDASESLSSEPCIEEEPLSSSYKSTRSKQDAKDNEPSPGVTSQAQNLPPTPQLNPASPKHKTPSQRSSVANSESEAKTSVKSQTDSVRKPPCQPPTGEQQTSETPQRRSIALNTRSEFKDAVTTRKGDASLSAGQDGSVGSSERREDESSAGRKSRISCTDRDLTSKSRNDTTFRSKISSRTKSQPKISGRKSPSKNFSTHSQTKSTTQHQSKSKRKTEEVEITDSTKPPTMTGSTEESQLTEDLSSADEDDDVFVTPLRANASMYHSTMSLSNNAENESLSRTNDSLATPSLSIDKLYRQYGTKRSASTSSHPAEARAHKVSRSAAEISSVRAVQSGRPQNWQLISSRKLWPKSDSSSTMKDSGSTRRDSSSARRDSSSARRDSSSARRDSSGARRDSSSRVRIEEEGEFSDSTKPPTLNDLTESSVMSHRKEYNTALESSEISKSDMDYSNGPARMTMRVYKNEAGEPVWELSLQFK